MSDYQLIDSGELEKLERFGSYTLIRPCSCAIWKKQKKNLWLDADARFTREGKEGWNEKKHFPETWEVEIEGVRFQLKLTPFGHLGVFPEHSFLWNWMRSLMAKRKKPLRILNLFAYSGGATLACALAGAEVVHLDASKGMNNWARLNAQLNNLDNHPIRWIVDDVLKFLNRERKRGALYDAIIMDPPTFGRGKMGEVFKIEKDLFSLFELSLPLLSKDPLFFLFSTHTPGYTPIVLEQLLFSMIKKKGLLESGELVLQGEMTIPSGSWAGWIFS